MASNIKYRHKVTLELRRDNNVYQYSNESITNVVINYDYENYNMPMMYIKISLEKEMIDWLIKNRENTRMTINISKYNRDDKLQIYTPYIRDSFIYFMDENLNDIKDLDYNESNDQSTNQRLITIGLMKYQNIVDNRITLNGVYDKVSLRDILLSNLTHMKLLIEPPRDVEINNLSIPITDTTVKLLKEINKEYNFYDTNYRYFIDYDMTYLLSSSGKGIPAFNERYNEIIFSVSNVTSNSSYIDGMVTDDEAKSYLIPVNSTDISLNKNKLKNSYNSYTGIDKEGNTININLNNKKDKTNRTKIIRTNNLDNVKLLAQDSNNDTIVNIVKSEIDSSIFTINKNYYIRNHDDERINGKYLLINKREVIVRKDDNFLDSCIFTLKKIV